MSQKIAEPIVYKIEDNHESLIKFEKELRQMRGNLFLITLPYTYTIGRKRMIMKYI